MAAPVLPEIDFNLESRLARLIRRRFLWMCAVEICFGLLRVIPFLTPVDAALRQSAGGWRHWSLSVVDLTLVVAAGVYAWRSPPNRRRLVGLVFSLVVVSGFLDALGIRLSFAFEPAAGAGAKSFLKDALPEVALEYLFAALFIRWSVRQALALAGTLLAVTLVMAVTFTGPTVGGSAVRVLLLSPLWFLPGVLICWWAHSRLLAKFRTQFESIQYRKFQTELTSARKLHDALLPGQIVDGPIRLSYVYEPMREIGGDLIYLHGGDRPGMTPSTVIVLDVTGHGIAAALTVNRLVGEIQRLFGENPVISPRQLVRALDRYISLTLSDHGIFATAFCAKLVCDSDRLEWYSGGHPSAFVCRKNGSLERLDSAGPMLGIDIDSANLEQLQTRFGPGDVLLCYTDGAIEAMNVTGRMVGTEGVEKILSGCASSHLPPGDWPAAILAGIRDHRRAPAEDDTLIAAFYCPEIE